MEQFNSKMKKKCDIKRYRKACLIQNNVIWLRELTFYKIQLFSFEILKINQLIQCQNMKALKLPSENEFDHNKFKYTKKFKYFKISYFIA